MWSCRVGIRKWRRKKKSGTVWRRRSSERLWRKRAPVRKKMKICRRTGAGKVLSDGRCRTRQDEERGGKAK